MKIDISKQGILNNLQRTFSSKTTFITELLQNSRRAGATEIDINLDVYNLAISDNGTGIQNWESLLTFGDSGWDPKSEERPYGTGFASALFAAKKVQVISNGKIITFNPVKHMHGEEIQLLPHPAIGETQVRLELKDGISEADIKDACRGFSVPVFLNGEELPRINRRRGSDLLLPGVGLVSASAISMEYKPSVHMYLQDVYVGSSRNYSSPKLGTYIHLNNSYDARFPDRNELIDTEAVRDIISKGLEGLKYKWLLDQLANIQIGQDTYAAHLQFVRAYDAHIRRWNLRDKFGWLIASMYEECFVDDYPVCYNAYCQEDPAIDDWGSSGLVCEFKHNKCLNADFDPGASGDFAALMWLNALELKAYSSSRKNAVELEPEDFEVHVTGEMTHKSSFGQQIVLADKVELSWGGEVLPDQWAHLNGKRVDIKDAFYHEGVIYVPMSDNFPERVMSQVNDYWDYDKYVFDERWRDEEEEDLIKWVDFQKSGDLKALLKQELAGVLSRTFHGKSATIKVSKTGQIDVEEVKQND